MNQKEINEILTRKATKKELKELIEMAKNEIEEWWKFIEDCKKQIN